MSHRLFLLFGMILSQTVWGMNGGRVGHPRGTSPGDKVESHLDELQEGCCKKDIKSLLKVHRDLGEDYKTAVTSLDDFKKQQYQEQEKTRSNKIKYFSIGLTGGLVVSLVGWGIRSYATNTTNSTPHQ